METGLETRPNLLLCVSQSKVSDSAVRPLKDACQHTFEASLAFDTLIGNGNALDTAATTLRTLAALTAEAVKQEPVHISNRLQVREEREPFQDKDMSSFLAMQQDERAQIDSKFQLKLEELQRQYAI